MARSHTIVAGLRLGATVDGDSGIAAERAANADDVNGALPDDEDGLTNPAADLVLTVGAQPTVNVRVTNTTGAAATLYGWIDYNANGVFDNATERASVAVPNGTNNGIVTLVFPAVPGGFTGTTLRPVPPEHRCGGGESNGRSRGRRSGRLSRHDHRPSDGTAESSKTRKIASGINGGPALANGDMFGSSVAALGDLDGDGVERSGGRSSGRDLAEARAAKCMCCS